MFSATTTTSTTTTTTTTTSATTTTTTTAAATTTATTDATCTRVIYATACYSPTRLRVSMESPSTNTALASNLG